MRENKIVGIDGKPIVTDEPTSTVAQDTAGANAEVIGLINKLVETGLCLQRMARVLAKNNQLDSDELFDRVFKSLSDQPIDNPINLFMRVLDTQSILAGVIHNSAVSYGYTLANEEQHAQEELLRARAAEATGCESTEG